MIRSKKAHILGESIRSIIQPRKKSHEKDLNRLFHSVCFGLLVTNFVLPSSEAMADAMFGSGPMAGYANVQYQNMVTMQTYNRMNSYIESSYAGRKSSTGSSKDANSTKHSEQENSGLMARDEIVEIIDQTIEMHYSIFAVRALDKYCQQTYPETYSGEPLRLWEERNRAADMETLLGYAIKSNDESAADFFAVSEASIRNWINTDQAGNQDQVCRQLGRLFKLDSFNPAKQPGKQRILSKLAVIAKSIREQGTVYYQPNPNN